MQSPEPKSRCAAPGFSKYYSGSDGSIHSLVRGFSFYYMGFSLTRVINTSRAKLTGQRFGVARLNRACFVMSRTCY